MSGITGRMYRYRRICIDTVAVLAGRARAPRTRLASLWTRYLILEVSVPEEDLAPGAARGVRVLLAYFLGEGRGDGEQVRFALSTDESLRKWRDLPGTIPSSVGERGIRDPFVLRDAGRRRFVLLGTDLRGWPLDDWERAVTRGSRSILISESSDLVSWSTPRLVPLAPEAAGNAWAPKAFWDSGRASW